MNGSKLTAVLLAATVLVAGAVGAVTATQADGNAPDDAGEQPEDAGQPDDAGEQADDRDANATEEAGNESVGNVTMPDVPENTSDAVEDPPEMQGPPTEMPDPVPDHVSQIHDLIRQKLLGELGGDLGPAISDVTPDEGAVDEETVEAEEPNEDEEAGDDETDTEENADSEE